MDPEKSQWLFSLEDPKSHDMFYFKTVDEYISFIRDITNTEESRQRSEGKPKSKIENQSTMTGQ